MAADPGKDREAKQAAALRANLRRRKEQARAREAAAPDGRLPPEAPTPPSRTDTPKDR